VEVGAELAPADSVGAAGFGSAVALSTDGRTMLVGGPEDNGGVGAAWVYEWTGSEWSESGKLTPVAGGGSGARFGSAVAISGDGSTALVGAPGSGEVDVFVRSGGGWSLQATLSPQGLVASAGCTGCNTRTSFGSSVALSADGDTALVGASTDTCPNCGAVVAFVRSGGSWAQQGPPLRPNDETIDYGPGKVPYGGFGSSVSLSADGNTALIGDQNDGAGCITACAGPGAAWVFTRQGQTWSQLGAKVTGPGGYFFGTGVLSADGNSALIGGEPLAQVFSRSGSSWVPQFNAITHYRPFGQAVALGGDGNTALLTGSQDCNGGVAGSFIDTSAGWAAEPQLVASAQVGSVGEVSDQALSGDGSIAVLGESYNAGSNAGAVLTFAHRTAPFTVPTVTAVTPGALPPFGLGTQVAISGSGFSGTTSVTFGGVPAQYFCVVSPSEILATWSPSQPPPLGPADVVVSTPAGSSPTPGVPNFYVTTIPSTPTGVRATPGDHAATVTFTASTATSSPITYTIRSDPSGRTVQTSGTHATITGLTPGQPYTFTVQARDPLGSSPPTTTSSTVVPYAAPTLGGGRISGLQSGAPRLRFTLHAGAGTAGVRLLTISLPSGLRFRTIRHGISISAKQHLRLIRGRLRIVLTAPARELRVAIAPPALAASASLTRRAQRHANARRPLTLRFTITVAEPDGTTTTLRASLSSW
jgi:Fibronectin type III domain/FG-GAP repeat